MRVAEDIRRPGACPECGASGWRRLPCDNCPHVTIDRAMAETADGQLLGRVFAIDAALQMKIHIGLEEITSEEFRALRILYAERARKQEDDIKRERAQEKTWHASNRRLPGRAL